MTYQNFATKLGYISIAVYLLYYMFDMTGSMMESENMYATIYDEESDSNLVIDYLIYLVTALFYAQYFKNPLVRGLIISVFGLLIPFLFLNDPFNLPALFDYILIVIHFYVNLLFMLIFAILLLTKLLLKKENKCTSQKNF